MQAINTYTARQIGLFYTLAERRAALNRADNLEDLSVSFVGKISPIAEKIRQQYAD